MTTTGSIFDFTDLIGYGGHSFAAATKVLFRGQEFESWDAFLACLREGPVVRVRCISEGNRSYSLHDVRLHGDGTVEPLTHRQPEDLNIEAELMMLALGGDIPTCRAAMMFLPDRMPVPRGQRANQYQTIGLRARIIHTAVLWAQDPATVWTDTVMSDRLRYAITPAVQREWQAAGWRDHEALRFHKHLVPLNLANRWRAAGKVSVQDARLAATGAEPNQLDAWIQVGFSEKEAARWQSQGWSVEAASPWARLRVTPSQAKHLNRILDRRTDLLTQSREWIGAGVPAGQVSGWMNHFTDVQDALDWLARGVTSGYAATGFDRLVRRGLLREGEVAGWTALGFQTADQVEPLRTRGYTAASVREVLQDCLDRESRVRARLWAALYEVRSETLAQSLRLDNRRRLGDEATLDDLLDAAVEAVLAGHTAYLLRSCVSQVLLYPDLHPPTLLTGTRGAGLRSAPPSP